MKLPLFVHTSADVPFWTLITNDMTVMLAFLELTSNILPFWLKHFRVVELPTAMTSHDFARSWTGTLAGGVLVVGCFWVASRVKGAVGFEVDGVELVGFKLVGVELVGVELVGTELEGL
jgi:hypothetical protein